MAPVTRCNASPDDCGQAEAPAPVAAATVIDCVPGSDRYGKVLVVVRDPRTNATHPDTVSVPTQRIPPELLGALSSTGRIGRWSSSEATTGHDPLIFVVESILSRKLGLADALEAGTVVFEARTGRVTVGEASYGTTVEPIAMANVLVRILRGPGWVPERTASFSCIRWVDPAALIGAFETKEPLLLFPDADPLEVCIHGLCVSTTTDLVRGGAVGDALRTASSL